MGELATASRLATYEIYVRVDACLGAPVIYYYYYNINYAMNHIVIGKLAVSMFRTFSSNEPAYLRSLLIT